MGDEASAEYYAAAAASAAIGQYSFYNAKCQAIANNMRVLMTRAYCYICGVQPGCGLHYGTPHHLSKAVHWVAAMTGTRNPYVIAQVFCAPCNAPLIAGDVHYFNMEHKINEEYFCPVCLRINQQPIQCQHIYSASHNKNMQARGSAVEFSKLIRPNQLGMAIELQHHLTPVKCWLCDHTMQQNDSHYRTKKHLKKVGGWINLHKFRFGLFGFRSWHHLYCECCNAVFIDAHWAFRHYESEFHRKNMTLFCNICRTHFMQGRDLRNHLQLLHGLDVSDHAAFESYAGISWCENIKELLTLDECELCARLLVDRKEAQNHHHRSDLFDEVLNENPAKTANSTLKDNVVEEFKRAIHQIFLTGTLSLAEALQRLKTLNLTSNDPICKKSELKLCECLSKIVVNSRHPLDLVDTAAQDSAKLKLDMELSRLARNCKKLAVGVAVRYVRDLRSFILGLTSGRDTMDVGRIFSSNAVSEVDATLDTLEEELEILELLLEINQKVYVSCPTHSLSLVKRKGDIKIGVEVALDIVRKFNAGIIKITRSQMTPFCPFCHSLPVHSPEDTDLHDCHSKVLTTVSSLWEHGCDEAAADDLTSFRLRMEIARTKAFLSKANVFPVQVALAYIERFNDFIFQVKRRLETDKINVENVFGPWDNEVTCGVFLHREMHELYYWLTQCRHYFELEVALDIITQFNAGLQSLVDTYNCDIAYADEGASTSLVNSQLKENDNFTMSTEDHYSVNVDVGSSILIESILVNCNVTTNVEKGDIVGAENDIVDCHVEDVDEVEIAVIGNNAVNSATVMDSLVEPQKIDHEVTDVKNYDDNDIIVIGDSQIENSNNADTAVIIDHNFAEIGNDDAKNSTVIDSLADDYKECSDVEENYVVTTIIIADSPIERAGNTDISMTTIHHSVTDSTNDQTNSNIIIDNLVDVTKANSDISDLESDNVVTVIANSQIVQTDYTDVDIITDHDGGVCIDKNDDGSNTPLGDIAVIDVNSGISVHCDVATANNDDAGTGSENDWDWTCVGC
ncbi:uncharacterized protein [Euwallacea similis]|uniref:uncharacterized protein n=1 Tax=Euwallacea similis TaxID=1736056 RepID=UPI00344DCCD0